MSSGGDDGVAPPAAQSDISHDLLGLGDISSSHGGHSSEDSGTQNHNRNTSGSSSVYLDAVEGREPSLSISDEMQDRGQLQSGLVEGGVKLKGKETSRTDLESLHESAAAGRAFAPQLPGTVNRDGASLVAQPKNTEFSQTEQRRQNVSPAEFNRLDSQVPNNQGNTKPSNNNTENLTRIRIPDTRATSYGARVNAEEDRRNWEKIQALSGPSTSTYNSVPGGNGSSAGSVAQHPARLAQKRKSISSDNTRGLDGARSSIPDAHPGHIRPPPYDESFVSSRNITRAPRAQQDSQQLGQDVVVPRWQPDAEVTICPICATQFSFFVRKHHCRKCGRVVCNACSPHRITIPYQFIVQPPESTTMNNPNPGSRPALDPARVGSSSEFETLGGGERVRLCNPCVPDPNTAPPQTPRHSLAPQRTSSNGHSRSASSVNQYTAAQQPSLSSSNPSSSLFAYYAQNQRPRPRQPSILGRPNEPQNSSIHQAYTIRNDMYANQTNSDTRPRSTTVSGSGVRQDQNPLRSAVPGSLSTRISGVQSSSGSSAIRNTAPYIPRAELQTRPLPRAPRPPRIAEEDECPVCHQELPSSQLPNSEALRAAHITNCIENAMLGTTSTPSPPPSTSTNLPSSSAAPSSSSTSAVLPTPIANTPEARMAAREQAHAAVVLGQRSSPTPAFRRTGVFPYKATEKDCVDDAECTICLEEFEVGQDMGRLECFCRFHLHCIREWFVNHYGQCPVHHQSAY